MGEIEELRERIRLLEEENARLRSSKEKEKNAVNSSGAGNASGSAILETSGNSSFVGLLEPDQIERYSRQLLLHKGFGVEGQSKLLKSSVLVVGAGGIGSTGETVHIRDISFSRKKYGSI